MTTNIPTELHSQMASAFAQLAAASDAMRELAETFTAISGRDWEVKAAKVEHFTAPDPEPEEVSEPDKQEQKAEQEPEKEITLETLRPRFQTASKAAKENRDKLMTFISGHGVKTLPELDAKHYAEADQLLKELGA